MELEETEREAVLMVTRAKGKIRETEQYWNDNEQSWQNWRRIELSRKFIKEIEPLEEIIKPVNEDGFKDGGLDEWRN